eukprot:g10091.t1
MFEIVHEYEGLRLRLEEQVERFGLLQKSNCEAPSLGALCLVVSLDNGKHWLGCYLFRRRFTSCHCEQDCSQSPPRPWVAIVFDTLELDVESLHRNGLLDEGGTNTITKNIGRAIEFFFLGPICDYQCLDHHGPCSTVNSSAPTRTSPSTKKIYYDRYEGRAFRKVIVQPTLQSSRDGTCQARCLAVLLYLRFSLSEGGEGGDILGEDILGNAVRFFAPDLVNLACRGTSDKVEEDQHQQSESSIVKKSGYTPQELHLDVRVSDEQSQLRTMFPSSDVEAGAATTGREQRLWRFRQRKTGLITHEGDPSFYEPLEEAEDEQELFGDSPPTHKQKHATATALDKCLRQIVEEIEVDVGHRGTRVSDYELGESGAFWNDPRCVDKDVPTNAFATARNSDKKMYAAFRTLGLPSNCQYDEAKKAYRKLCLEKHPDKPSGNKEEFLKISEAWTLLQDTHFNKLAGGGPPGPSAASSSTTVNRPRPKNASYRGTATASATGFTSTGPGPPGQQGGPKRTTSLEEEIRNVFAHGAAGQNFGGTSPTSSRNSGNSDSGFSNMNSDDEDSDSEARSPMNNDDDHESDDPEFERPRIKPREAEWMYSQLQKDAQKAERMLFVDEKFMKPPEVVSRDQICVYLRDLFQTCKNADCELMLEETDEETPWTAMVSEALRRKLNAYPAPVLQQIDWYLETSFQERVLEFVNLLKVEAEVPAKRCREILQFLEVRDPEVPDHDEDQTKTALSRPLRRLL